MNRKTALAAAVVASLTSALVTRAQDQTTTADTPAQLIEALRAAGYDLSEITTVNEDGTVSITLPPTPEPTETDAAYQEAQVESESIGVEPSGDAPLPEPEPEPEWDSKVTLAFGYSDGNTEISSFTALFTTERETDETRLAFDAAYFWGKDSGDLSENRFTAGAVHDWYLGERWIVFVSGRYDYDDFKSWRQRIASHAGVGYRLINEDSFKLTPRIGMGASREFDSDNDDIIPEGLAGTDLEWNISERQSLVASSYYFPNFDDIGEFRWINTAGWNLAIDQADGLSLTVGFIHEYESDVDASTDQNDFRLFGGLTFDF